MPEKLEVTRSDAIIAMIIVGLVMVAAIAVQAGWITNPLTIGLVVTIAIALIMVGHALTRAGVFGKNVLPMWYVLTFGIVMLVYGGIVGGYIPIAFTISHASVMEIAITNAMFYTLLALAVAAGVAVVYATYRYYKKRALAVTY